MNHDVVLGWIDTETGGLDPEQCALLEVAIVRTRVDGEILTQSTNTLRALPGMLVCDDAFRLHKLDGQTGLEPKLAWEWIRRELEGTLAAGFNVTFDLKFLRQLCLQVGGELVHWGSYRILDVMGLILPLWLFGKLESCQLSQSAKELGIEVVEPSHRALSDVLTTIKLYRKVLEMGGLVR